MWKVIWGGSKNAWAEIISSNFSHLYGFSLNEFLASLCLQETGVCFGHPHLCVVSSRWDSWISGYLWVGSLLHFKWHQKLLSMVDNWTLLRKAMPPTCLRYLFQCGLGDVASPRGLRLDAYPRRDFFVVIQVRQFNSAFCVIPFMVLLEIVWTHKSFRPHKSSQKISSEQQYLIFIYISEASGHTVGRTEGVPRSTETRH